MIEFYESNYNGADISAPALRVVEIIVPYDCDLPTLTIKIDPASTAQVSNPVIFNVKKNGTDIGSDITMPTGDITVDSSPAISLVEGDILSLHIVTITTGVVKPLVALICQFDDGVSGGGGGGAHGVDKPPASPSAQDDEFEGTSLDGKWTVVPVSGTAPSNVVGAVDSHLITTFGAAAGKQTIDQAFVPASADFSFITKMIASCQTNYQNCGIQVANGSGDFVGIQLISNSGLMIRNYSYIGASFTEIGSVSGITLEQVFLRLQRIGGTYKMAWSSNGIIWHELTTGTPTLTVALIQLAIDQGGASLATVMAFDWIRKDI